MKNCPRQFRYRVVRTWGKVPSQIREIVGKDGAFLLYPEFRGAQSDQGFTEDGVLLGGWDMEYAGRRTPLKKEQP